jgi:hypothetical protein
MADTKVYQYALTVKWGNKLIKGLETTGFKNKPNFDDVLLKENEGSTSKEFVDCDTELSIGGKTLQRDGTISASVEDFETLRIASSVGAQVAFVYGRMTAGAQQVTGYGYLTDWGEDAGSEKKMGNWTGTITARKGTVNYGVQAG